MPFTPEAPRFLFENYTRNDKEWFKAHKDIYQKELLEPFGEMIRYLTPLMNKIDDKIICDPKKVSRIYRDVRLIRDGMFFRKSLWCSLMRPKERFESKPEFFFWAGADNFGWGCGYYKITTEVMENIRELIIAKDKTAMEAIAAYEGQQSLVLGGELYKKDHFPQQPENLKSWLNRKNLHLTHESDNSALYFSESLPERVCRDFEKIAPVYRLFIKAEEMLLDAKDKK